MRISDWSSDVCSSDLDQVGYWLYEPATGLILQTLAIPRGQIAIAAGHAEPDAKRLVLTAERGTSEYGICSTTFLELAFRTDKYQITVDFHEDGGWSRSEEHTSELQSLMRISYAVFCLKKKTQNNT